MEENQSGRIEEEDKSERQFEREKKKKNELWKEKRGHVYMCVGVGGWGGWGGCTDIK